MGMALQLAVMETASRVLSWGFKNMLGIRNQVMVAVTLVRTRADVQCLEQDMEDMCLEVPKDKVSRALTQALGLLSTGQS